MNRIKATMNGLTGLLARDDIKDDAKVVIAAAVAQMVSCSQLESLLNWSRDMLYVRDLSTGGFQFVSESAKEVLGVTAEELVRDPSALSKRMHPDDLQGIAAVAEQETKPRDPFETSEGKFLYRILHNTAAVQWVEEHWQIHRDECGAASYAVGRVQKVSARDPDTDYVEEGVALTSTENLRLIAGSLAHDLNNLLGVTLGNIDLVQHTPSSDPKIQHRLGLAELATQRAFELNQRLARLGRTEINSDEQIDLAKVLTETVALISQNASYKVKFHTDFPEQLPTILGDEHHLRRALLNVVKNAVEALLPDGGTVRIGLQLLEGQSVVILTVEDDGCGMDEEALEKMFEPFFTTKPSGTGLGLAIIQTILRQHEGEIDVSSTPDIGTIVSITLPIVQQTKP